MRTKINPFRKSVCGKMVLTLAIAVVLLVAMAGSASADTLINHCDFHANKTGERYYLTADVPCSAGQHGVMIEANGVVIDGQGHALIGNKTNCPACDENSPENAYCGIYNYNSTLGRGHDDVVVNNLTVRNFCMGILVKGEGSTPDDTPIDNNTIFNCTVRDNGVTTTNTYGIYLYRAENSDILNCTVSDNTGEWIGGCAVGGHGIKLLGNCRHCNISWNNITRNRMAGIFTKMKCNNCTASYNNVWENGEIGHEAFSGGIVLMCQQSNDWVVEHNNKTDCGIGIDNNTGQYGIFLGGDRNEVRWNTVEHHKYGLNFRGSGDNNQIRNNSFRENEEGIHVFGDRNELYHNTVCRNTVVDIKDGGTNTYGDWNTCDTTDNYDDDGEQGCTDWCPLPPYPDYIVLPLDVSWIVQGSSYNVTFTVKNKGGVNATIASNTLVKITNKTTGAVVHEQRYNTPALNGIHYPGNSSTTEIGTFGPFNFTAGPHVINVTADIDGSFYEGVEGEKNNLTTRTFGCPDLIVSHFWFNTVVDPDWKTYYLEYKVKNIGDNATPRQCWINFTEINASTAGVGEWSGCVDPIPIPVLAANGGVTPLRTAGPFVMGVPPDWLMARVDYNDTIPENDESCNPCATEPDNCNRFQHNFGGCLDNNGDPAKCGDVNGDAIIGDIDDIIAITFTNIDTCEWAADVNCDCIMGADIDDVIAITFTQLNCCGPGCYNSNGSPVPDCTVP